jgi:hypothetical protein
MAQTQVQYTPVQVLQAARRAEAEGKMDYALQFYRHIVEHHGTAIEAQEAREGLFRIAEWRWGEARIARRQEAAVANGYSGQGGQSVQSVQSGQPQQQRERVAVTPAATSAQQQSYTPEPADSAVPMTGATRMPQIIAREAAAQAAEGNEAPVAYKARYRVARFMALLLSGCGWASVLGGVAVALLAFADATADVSAVALLGLPLGIVLGVPAAVIGLVLIVTGYLAVAVFESTNATLEQLSMRRRRAGY